MLCALSSRGFTHVACDYSSIVASTEGKDGKDVLKAYSFTSWTSLLHKKVPTSSLHNPLEGGTFAFIMNCSSHMLTLGCSLVSLCLQKTECNTYEMSCFGKGIDALCVNNMLVKKWEVCSGIRIMLYIICYITMLLELRYVSVECDQS